jgi:hypothetical protein
LQRDVLQLPLHCHFSLHLEVHQADATHRIYFAGPLFSESERNWIKTTIPRIQNLATELDTPVKIIWPWELFSPGDLDGFGDQVMHEVFKHCREHIDSTDMMIDLLDGAPVATGPHGRSNTSTPSGTKGSNHRRQNGWPVQRGIRERLGERHDRMFLRSDRKVS